MTLRSSTPQREGIYQGSKYLKYQVLCSAAELLRLFERLTPFSIYLLTGFSDGNPIDPFDFISKYHSWIELLQRGEIPTDSQLRELLACAFTTDANALWKQELPGGKSIVKMAKPVVQLQTHFFTYSEAVFRPMTMGSKSIFWGIQFAFPQIYQESKTMEFLATDESINVELFQKIKQWVRDDTRPTPFLVEGKKINVPIRLGKGCFAWIHRHPQLIQQGIAVDAN